ncbi:MAG TPA: flagellar hook-associated protein FlgL [Parasulfuritortus sp.]
MRISSNSFYTSTLSGIMDQQSAIARLTQQIASGKKLLSAADDPVAASQIMSLNDRISLNTQYSTNQTSIGSVQSEETVVLNQMQSYLQTAQATLSSVNASTDQNNKDSAAATLASIYQEIKNLANYQDTNGNYIFAGFNTTTQPYSHSAAYGTGATTSSATTYSGDNGIRQVQVSQGVTVQANDNLNSVMLSGSASDLLQTLDQTAINLKANTSTLSTDLPAAYTTVTNALTNLKSIQVSLAGRQTLVTNQQTTTTNLLTSNQDTLGNLSTLDQAKAIVELQTRQTLLQSAESSFATVSKLSIFNYL